MTDLFHDLRPWRLFLKTLDTGSFSRTAIESDLAVSQVSRAIANIEKELGTELFDRSTRPLMPTAAARVIEGKLRPAMAQWSAFAAFVLSPTAPRHTIRLSTPIGIGRFYLNKQIAEYTSIDPSISIETTVEQGIEELLTNKVDVVFVPFAPKNASLTVYPAMHGFTMPVASPKYIATHGIPKAPEDLINHIGILKTGERFPASDSLELRGDRRTIFWKSVIRHNDMLNIVDAVLKGFGIAVDVPLGMILTELRSGDLVQVLDNWHRPHWDYSIVTRASDTADTPIGKFAQWYARRATAEIDERRRAGFEFLGLNESSL